MGFPGLFVIPDDNGGNRVKGRFYSHIDNMICPNIVWAIAETMLSSFNGEEGKGVTTKRTKTATMSTSRMMLL